MDPQIIFLDFPWKNATIFGDPHDYGTNPPIDVFIG